MSAEIRVVIADDHHVVREGLRMILSEADGIEVVRRFLHRPYMKAPRPFGW